MLSHAKLLSSVFPYLYGQFIFPMCFESAHALSRETKHAEEFMAAEFLEFSVFSRMACASRLSR